VRQSSFQVLDPAEQLLPDSAPGPPSPVPCVMSGR
jgi:hypothetical protein